jgi:threonine dehydrogenase-like Zn-dependent dehydrogenase
MKGASRVIGIDNIPDRLTFAQESSGIEVIDFGEHTDVVKRIQELVPGGLDIAIDCGVSHAHSFPYTIACLTLGDFYFQAHSTSPKRYSTKSKRR